MRVNPAYKDIDLPVDNWPLLDDVEAPAFYTEQNPCYRNSPTPYLQLVLNPLATLGAINLNLQFGNSAVATVCRFDGVDATEAIRGAEVTAAVSTVAAVAEVRKELVERQRAWVAERGGGVVEGRDIGSVVFPDARLKVYLTASPEVRARRRAGEIGDADVEWVAADIRRRDDADSGRVASPLVAADGSVTIDTSDLDIDEVVAVIVGLL